MITAVLEFLKVFWPYLLATSVGFGGAWEVQAVRLDAAHNEFAAYKTNMAAQRVAADDKAEKQRQEASDEYAKNLKTLADDGAAYKRCVAAGKCGGLRTVPRCSGNGLSAPSGVNGTGSDAVPPAGETSPEVITDCAKTTLMLNQLQNDISIQTKEQ